MNPAVYRLRISCPDQPGIVASVGQFIYELGGNIVEANHHTDHMTGWFYMRHEIAKSSINLDLPDLKTAFTPLAEKYQMQWELRDSAEPPRIALFVSKESHCLADLLYRWYEKDLPGKIVCVVGNHPDLQVMARWYGVPFYHVPVLVDNKPAAFEQMQAIIDGHRADVIVLARYMQIIPPHWCDLYAGRIINIHHSFLPSFVGAKPYHQAYERGVKLIGATCHYVTADLDAGPIIEQDVIRITHAHTIDDMKRLGRDVEKTVLARGLRYHLEDRVLVHGNKTIVFSN